MCGVRRALLRGSPSVARGLLCCHDFFGCSAAVCFRAHASLHAGLITGLYRRGLASTATRKLQRHARDAVEANDTGGVAIERVLRVRACVAMRRVRYVVLLLCICIMRCVARPHAGAHTHIRRGISTRRCGSYGSARARASLSVSPSVHLSFRTRICPWCAPACARAHVRPSTRPALHACTQVLNVGDGNMNLLVQELVRQQRLQVDARTHARTHACTRARTCVRRRRWPHSHGHAGRADFRTTK